MQLLLTMEALRMQRGERSRSTYRYEVDGDEVCQTVFMYAHYVKEWKLKQIRRMSMSML